LQYQFRASWMLLQKVGYVVYVFANGHIA
jgi:hypothetical protein